MVPRIDFFMMDLWCCRVKRCDHIVGFLWCCSVCHHHCCGECVASVVISPSTALYVFHGICAVFSGSAAFASHAHLTHSLWTHSAHSRFAKAHTSHTKYSQKNTHRHHFPMLSDASLPYGVMFRFCRVVSTWRLLVCWRVMLEVLVLEGLCQCRTECESVCGICVCEVCECVSVCEVRVCE